MKNSRTSIALMLCLAFGMAACAGVDPSSLKKTSSTSYVTIPTPVKYSESFVAGNQHYTLKAGKYKSLFTDGTGIYFEGDGKCFNIKYENNLPEENLRCGVYVVAGGAEEPKIYFYRDPEMSAKVFKDANAEGTLIHAFDQAELDNLHFFPYQPGPGILKQAIKVSN